MFEFHTDRKRYFEMQVLNAEKYVIPFIEQSFPIKKEMRVLEIGAGEGGVLKAFINKGCTGVGVELDSSRVQDGNKWLKEDLESGKLRLMVSDIYDVNAEDLGGSFDIIILKDVIEHIHNQSKLIERFHSFLKPGGIIYFGFPPWQMPFGGHQQMCVHSLSKVPYIHLFPKFFYKKILQLFKEDQGTIDILLEVKETGISIERFERILKGKKYKIIGKTHYLINPIYEWKFGWKPKVQNGLLSKIPYLRNYFTTCVYYLVTPESSTL